MADELDTAGAVAAYLGTRNQEQAVRSTVTLASGVNPDEEAEYRRLAKAAGIPVDSVRENKAAVQQQVNAPDFTDLAERFPSTSKYLANIDNARLAHDDIDSLKEIEQSFRQAQTQGRAVRGKVDEPFSRPGDQRTSGGRVGETFLRRGELAADDGSYVGGLLDANRFRVPFAGARISIADQLGLDPTGAIRDFERISSRAEAAKPQIDSVTGRAIYGGLDSLVTMAPGLAASILLANPAPVLAWAGVTTGGSAYGKYRARGGTPGQAAMGAVGEGAVEVATELLPMGFLVSRFGKAGAGEFITGLLAREVPSEQVATFVQDAIDTAVANPDKTWEEFVRERPQAAYETLVSTVVQSGAMAGVSAVVRNTVMREQASQYEAKRAEEAAALAENLAKVAEASKLKERDPEAFKEFIAQVAESGDGPAEFYVDAQQLANSLNQSAVTLQELRAVAPSVAAQLEAGFVPGADIRVPAAEFAAAPADIATALIDHLRESPDAMSRAEAQEFLKAEGDRIKQDVQTVLADETTRAARQQAADTARQVFEEQLAAAGRFRPEVNRAYATVLGNFYATQAERSGMTVEEFLDRYQLRTGKVQPGPLGGRQTLEQADTQTPEFRNWFGDSQVVDAEGKPLVVYHGTADDFTSFSAQEGGKNVRTPASRAGFFFSDRPDIAERYAQMREGTQQTMPVYLSMQNPTRATVSNMVEADRLLAAGFDGDGAIITVNTPAPGITRSGFLTQTVYAVKDPTQIKSAIGNRGTFDPNDPNILNQGPRATITFANDITSVPSIIQLFEGADLSSFLHESGHFFLEVQADLAARIAGQIRDGVIVTDAERGIVADMDAILGWMGIEGTPDVSRLDTWLRMTLEEKREHHEKWARGFERYLMEGKAPSQDLQSLFSKFRAWLVSVYQALKNLNVDLNDEVRQVMDRMLATDEAIKEAEAARNMGPLFESPEQAGMTPAQYADYQALGARQTTEAAAQLDARLLKDMKWLSKARDKALKARQDEVEHLRREVLNEVRATVLSTDVYQAWQFLTGKRPKPLEKSAEETAYLEDMAQWQAKRKEAEGEVTKDIRAAMLAEHPDLKKLERGQLLAKNKRQIDLQVQQSMLEWEKTYPKPRKPAPIEEPMAPGFEVGKLNTDAVKKLDAKAASILQERRMTSPEGWDPDLLAERFGFTSGDHLVKAVSAAPPPEQVIEEMVDRAMLERHGDITSPEALARAADEAVYSELRARVVATELKALEKASKGARKRQAEHLPPVPAGMTRIWHGSAQHGRYDGKAWFSTDRKYAENYRDGAELQYVDYPTDKLNAIADPDGYGQTVEKGFTVNVELDASETGPRKPVPTTAQRSTIDAMARAAKEFAYAVIAGQRERDLRPSQYAAAQARSARLAQQALGKSTEEAAMHKRNELINGYAAKAAYEAQDEVKALQRYFRKFDKRVDGIDAGYQDQIEQLLERFDFRPASLKAIDKRKSFRAWYDEQVEAGNPPDVPEEILNDSARKSYKDMTVEELRGLRDTVKQIEHQGRLKKKLLLARDTRDFEAVAQEIVASIVEHGGPAREVKLEGENAVVDWFAGVAAQHRKLASLFRQMDGNVDAGPLWRHIGQAMNERSTMEDVAIEQATVKLRELYEPLTKMRGGITGHRSKVFIPEIGDSLTRGGRLSVALNWGNEANRQRIMDGDKWSVGQVQAILKTLTREELDFVNRVWEFLDSYWPEIAAKEKRLTGVEPPKVEAAPFNVKLPDGTEVAMRGGYYPLSYDTERSDRADQHEAAQAAKEMMQGVFTKATTRRGHTKERLKEVKRAVRKDLNVITQHVTQVVHDLAWHEWLVDTNKLLGDERIAGAIRDHYGPKVLKTIRDDILGIATADVVPQTDVDKALLVLRSNVTRATMGASLTTAFLQPFGLTQSIVRIGGRHVLRGMARWGGDAVRMESSLAWIHERSDFMRLRAKTFNRELREIKGTVDGKSKILRVADAGLFYFMQKMQMVADVPTWLGQYEKSKAEGLAEADAVAMADRAVLEAQGGGSTKDLAEVQRKHPMLTQFYSYFSTTLQLVAEQTAATDFKNPRAVAGWTGDMALLLVIPAILPSLLMYSLKGGAGDDDEKKWAKRIVEWQVSYLLGMVVLARELSGAISGFDYAGPPVGRIAAVVTKAGKQTAQGEIDEPLVLAYINLLGSALGIPTVQLVRSYKGWKAWDEGRQGAGPLSVLFGLPPRD